MLRRILLVLAILGAVLLATEEPPELDVLPLPPSMLTVRMPLHVLTGEYDLLVSMAKIGNELGLTSETVPCDLSLRIDEGGVAVVSQSVTSITRSSEVGYQNTQQYRAHQPFHLRAGTYNASITGGAKCASAAARGATVTFEKQEREHILGSLLRAFASRAFLAVGLLGLVALEFRRRPDYRLERP